MMPAAPLSTSEDADHRSQRFEREEWSGSRLQGRRLRAGGNGELDGYRSARGFTVGWSKEHVAHVGSAEHARITGESNPFSCITVTVTVPWAPELTVSEGDK
jgi:hypothetical protein